MSDRKNFLVSVVLLVISIAGFAYSGISGPSSRTWPSKLVIIEASTSDELYSIWTSSGISGLRIVNMSSFLNYSEPEVQEGYMPTPEGKAPYTDMSALLHSEVNHANYLWAAQESGIARSIEHIVPATTFSQKAAYARTIPGIVVSERGIELSDYGTPRVISSIYAGDDEPVMLNIDASYFDNADMDEFLSAIGNNGRLKPVIISLYYAEDSPDVTENGRKALKDILPMLDDIYLNGLE